MQSCFSLIPQPPKKDFIKMLENDGKVLRYAARMVSKNQYTAITKYDCMTTFKSQCCYKQQESPNPVDQSRVFIISFWLSDDTLSIFESPQR